MSNENGEAVTVDCAIAKEFRFYAETGKDTMRKVGEMHAGMEQLVAHTKHLERLDDIATRMGNQCVKLDEIKNGLLIPATSKLQTDNETVKLIVKILGGVIIGLVFVIVFILTGKSFHWMPS